MAVYFFNLKLSDALIRDRNGVICADDDAAREYGRGVARELMQHREVGCRAWRMQVCNVVQVPLFEILFVDEDDTLAGLAPQLARSIRDVSATLARTLDTLNEIQASLTAVGAMIEAHEAAKPR